MSDDRIEKIRQQFNFGPYPQIPIEQFPGIDPNLLFVHNFVTPYYLHYRRVPELEGRVILDAGCGTGYGTLALAAANPGAQVVGVDVSEKSIELARSRVAYHNRQDIQFHVLDLQDLPRLGLTFDYINCDEVLYLFPEPAIGLQGLKAVLQPGGIIRANLQSALQRAEVYQAQAAFRMLGLFDQNPEVHQVEAVQDVMASLHRWVNVKERTWRSSYEQADATEHILMNYLFQGDRGYTIPQLFAALEASGLQFIKMVNWHQWHLQDLFRESELPEVIQSRLPQMSQAEKLELFELLHPVHRLLDFWCVLPADLQPQKPIAHWEPVDWAKRWSHITAHLHPQLRTSEFREACLTSLKAQKPLAITSYLKAPSSQPILLDTRAVTCLLPLIEEPQPMVALIRRWIELYPRDPVSMEPISPEIVLVELKQILTRLEPFLYVLLEEN